VAAAATITTGIAAVAAVAAAQSAPPRSPRPLVSRSAGAAVSVALRHEPAAKPAVRPAVTAQAPLALTASDRRDCPSAATACVDLTRHITWLQADGKVSLGPVRMEPGKPGSAHATPRGTFHVAWKAGPGYMSNLYHEPMPWATFFATGGIAFHGGSLTRWSHGCVHLTVANAHLYQEKLPIGAEVVVF
jgi:lipoprotein-anchoring transpeptidase ErfK/SrfK